MNDGDRHIGNCSVALKESRDEASINISQTVTASQFSSLLLVVNAPFRSAGNGSVVKAPPPELGGNLHNVVLVEKSSYICVLRKRNRYQLTRAEKILPVFLFPSFLGRLALNKNRPPAFAY